MGTNFYLKRKLNKEQKEEIKSLIDSDGNYDDIINKLYDIQPIHIGKRSYGWKFLWNANNFKYFNPTKESLIEFLKSGTIIDEYDREFTFNQFWNEELEGFLDNGLDLKEYYKKHPEEFQSWLYYNDRNDKFIVEFGITPNKYNEFYIDNLRFTTCNEFC